MSEWRRNEAPGQPGWLIAGYYADPGWLVTDEQIRRLGREGVAGLTEGLPPLPDEAWHVAEVTYRDSSPLSMAQVITGRPWPEWSELAGTLKSATVQEGAR